MNSPVLAGLAVRGCVAEAFHARPRCACGVVRNEPGVNSPSDRRVEWVSGE
jgi:hypothetical protein